MLAKQEDEAMALAKEIHELNSKRQAVESDILKEALEQIRRHPEWLQDRLRIIGLRPINNIVDITNYIMMAYGQPLHCFDADMIEGGEVLVKTMPEGTPFITLDGTEHKLSERDLAICNAKEPMCIAGVFGGKGSGTYDTTCNELLESA
jgi:phenylalanyl-tRNA synthetase beta chain